MRLQRHAHGGGAVVELLHIQDIPTEQIFQLRARRIQLGIH